MPRVSREFMKWVSPCCRYGCSSARRQGVQRSVRAPCGVSNSATSAGGPSAASRSSRWAAPSQSSCSRSVGARVGALERLQRDAVARQRFGRVARAVPLDQRRQEAVARALPRGERAVVGHGEAPAQVAAPHRDDRRDARRVLALPSASWRGRSTRATQCTKRALRKPCVHGRIVGRTAARRLGVGVRRRRIGSIAITSSRPPHTPNSALWVRISGWRAAAGSMPSASATWRTPSSSVRAAITRWSSVGSRLA